MRQDKSYASTPTTPQWGPKVDGLDNVAAGSLEDRQSLLQAKKREALLLGSAEEVRDASGRFKRRDSDANIRSASLACIEEDALVYVHKIQRNDTLPGVMLKYGCQPDVFRKVNRFWPNDNIQVRNHVFLPVEACTIRGKKVDAPHTGPDLLGPALEDLAKTTMPGKGGLKRMTTKDQTRTPAETASPEAEPFPSYASSPDNPDLKHDSWVTVPNFPEPIAILRMPRSSLGYFPRARRKSLTKTIYSDASPRSSFDNLRHPPSHAAQMSLSHSLTTSPVRRPNLTAYQNPPVLSRKRSSSTTTTNAAAPQQHWTSVMTGPGGVGTLRGLRTEPFRPGPAEDSLNRTFRAYFPDLAIADPQQALEAARSLAPGPPWTGSYRNSPRASMDSTRSVRSNSSGLVDLASGMEGWVRKVAGGKKGKGAAAGGAGMTGSGMEDLIELEMTPGDEYVPTLTMRNYGDAGGEDEAEMLTPTLSGAESSATTGSQQQGEQDMLDERFPVRGRIRSAYDRGK